jgi:predicted nucleic acid-binding protein
VTLLLPVVLSTNVQPQALLDEKRGLDDAAERHWQQQQMQIAVATARVRELEAAIQVSFI